MTVKPILRKIMLLALLSLFLFAKCQTTGTKIYLQKLRWTVDIPNGYSISDTMENSPLWDEPEENKYNKNQLYYIHNTLFNIEKNKVNLISAALIPFNTESDGDWADFIQKNNEAECETFTSTGCTIDSASAKEIIASLLFNKFKMDIKIKNRLISQSIRYSRQFNNHTLIVTIVYADKIIGEQLIDIFKKSTFTSP
jgi:hypothetical protein